MKKLILLSLFCLVPCLSPALSFAAGDAPKPPKEDWSFNGPFGTYDKAALQRGYKVYKEVCAACHAMKRVHFRNLEALGYNENQIKNIAADYTVMDGPDDEGEMFERSALPKDAFPSPFPNAKAATAANGAYPPDMSLITKARHGGADYIFALLTGYEDASHGEGHDVPKGKHWNKYYPGHVITMANPLYDDDSRIAYEDGTPNTAEQYARDVSHFLTWAAEPEMEERKKLGIRVLIFLLVFAGIMYAVKKRVWKDVH